jgi:hypothetical protein
MSEPELYARARAIGTARGTARGTVRGTARAAESYFLYIFSMAHTLHGAICRIRCHQKWGNICKLNIVCHSLPK